MSGFNNGGQRTAHGNEKPAEQVIPWIEAKQMPEYDGDYLVHVVRKNECGNFSKYQRVIPCRMNEWVMEDNERVTHWRPLPDPPDRTVKLD